MSKRITDAFTEANPGDYLYDDLTGRKHEAVMCPDCFGSGLTGFGYTVYLKCGRCKGRKIVWVPVVNKYMAPP